WRHSGRALGFNKSDGRWVPIIVRDEIVGGLIQIEPAHDAEYVVKPGFSGTAVWDEELEGVIGMVAVGEGKSLDHKFDERLPRGVFIIPVALLVKACPELEGIVKTANWKTEELWERYRQRLSENVSRVRLLGESESRELKQVFVQLNIVEEYQRPSARNEWKGFVDLVLRKRRALFSADADYAEEDEEKKEKEDEKKKEKRLIKPEELLRDGTRAIITGPPGCGKSTLLRWLAGRCLDDNSPRLPVFLELKSINKKLFDDCGGNLGDLLFEQVIVPLLHFADQREREALKSAFIVLLAANHTAIFLDGLDEIRKSKFFKPLCEAINRFLDSPYGRNLLLISTRPYALDAQFSAKEMEIAPLNRAQVTDFLKHYYGNDPSVDLRGLIRRLERRELGEMVRVPVLLGALVRRFREKGELTGDRLKLYEDLVHDLVVTRDAEDNVERFKVDDPDGVCKLEFLEQVAFKKLFVESTRDDELWTFTTRWLFDEAKAYCPRVSIKKPQYFVADVKATALLREVAKGVWAFSHLTIQEYLAARVLARKSDCERIFCRNYFNPTLVEMEALPMVLGQLKEPDKIYRAIEQLPESLNFAGLRLRARGLAYNAGISHDLRKHLAHRLIDFISSNHTEETAYLDTIIPCFSEVGSNHSDYIVERVSQLLKSEDSNVRRKAAEALGEIGTEGAVAALIEALKDEDSDVRVRSAEVLGRIGGEQAVAALIEDLKSADSSVRWNAALALRGIGGEQAVAALIEDLKSADSDARGKAAMALGRIGGERAVSALIEALKSADSDARGKAAVALGRIGGEQAVAALIEDLKSADSSVHWNAALALRGIGGEQAVAALIEALKSEDSDVRGRAAVELGGIGGELAVASLIETLMDDERSVRLSAAVALGRIGGGKWS
ncbi:MAG: HEAT repeat domain-containing protein, partial [Acidobacteriales bacterium]|nr:HEAT repeat domain-containing protein [Terriglobales bacterium]